MGKARRVFYVMTGLLTIFFGLFMYVTFGEEYKLVIVILEVMLFFRGIRLLFYFITMARHMVSGKVILYEAIFFLDMGLFTMNLDDVPQVYAMLYLIAGLALSGVIDILRTREIRRLESGHWKYQVFTGVVKIGISVFCLLSLNSPHILVSLYSFGLVHSGVARVTSGVRPAAIVYIE